MLILKNFTPNDVPIPLKTSLLKGEASPSKPTPFLHGEGQGEGGVKEWSESD